MTQSVISVLPDTTLIQAVTIILNNGFNGIPVTNKEGVLVGILTEYDIVYKKNQGLLRDDMVVSDIMNTEPLSLSENATIEEVAGAFSEHHKVNPIPIVSENGRVVGIVSRHDIVKLFGSSFGTAGTEQASDTKRMNPVFATIVVFVIIGIIVLVLTVFKP